MIPKAAYLTFLCTFLFAAVLPLARSNCEFLKSRRDNEKLLRENIASLNLKPTQLYVAWATALKTDCVSVFDNYQWLKDFRCVQMGWNQASGISKKMKRHFGIDNLLAEWHKHPELIYISSPICQQLFGTYSLEHNNVGLAIYPAEPSSYWGATVSRFLPVSEVAKEPNQTTTK